MGNLRFDRRALIATILCSSILPGILVAGTGPAGAQSPLGEDEYVRRVVAASLEARLAERDAELSRTAAVGAGAWSNPTVEWAREDATSGTRAGESQDVVLVSIPLILSGRLRLQAEAAEQQVRAADARLVRARAELRRQATQRFAAALAAQSRCAILAASLRELDDLVAVIAAREQAGDASGYDRMRITLERAAVDDDLQGARVAERVAVGEAMRLLGAAAGEVWPLVGPLAPVRAVPDGAELRAGIEAHRADVRALALDARAAELARRAAARRWIPDPIVRGGVQVLDAGRSGSGAGYVVGLAVPLPIFQRHQGEEARALARREVAEARRQLVLRAAEARLATTLEEMQVSRARLEAHRTQVLARTSELKRSARAAYEGGAADLLVVVDAERAGRDAALKEIALAQAVVDAETTALLLAGHFDRAMEEESE
jgi:cobalt-zinc-cadmium efflux system outer membrane protein